MKNRLFCLLVVLACALMVTGCGRDTQSSQQETNTVSLELNENMTIYADPEKIARVFGNILKNASAYSYPNTTILVSAVQSEQHIAISFQNKGKTIPSEKLAALFDKFSRLDEARISDTGGTGLGLAIAKEIVLLHGRTIEAHSENETVTFTVQLPIS